MEIDKPLEPTAEKYGLSSHRLSVLRYPEVFLWEKPFWLSYLGIVLVGVLWLYAATDSILSFLALLFPVAFAIFILLMAVLLVASAVWRRSQEDYPAYLRYESAVSTYRAELAHWLRTQELWWQSLDGRRFEIELAMLLQKREYKVQWKGRSGDEGVDLALKDKDDRDIIVQCKAHKNPVGPAPVRELYGTLLHRDAAEAWLISTAGFSAAAKKFASGKPIKLVTIADILRS